MRSSPLRALQEAAGAVLVPYGPPGSEVHIVESFGALELEYAALRKGCILLDQPQRGVLEFTGADRLPFLNRMVTQELKDFAPGQVRRTFWLNRKGRIDADLRLIELGSRMLLDLDVHAVERTIKGLEAFVIAEDVQITDLTESMHRLALHGPTALAVLTALNTSAAGSSVLGMGSNTATALRVGSDEIIAARDDTTGEPGLELFVPAAAAVAFYQALVQAGHSHTGQGAAARINLRPAGWHAYNIGRIEAGTPLYNIDFGPGSLPHESGVIHDRVSFKKGCYLGQEIVARMESRGHSKRTLVALTCDVPDPAVPAPDRPQPTTGSQVRPHGAPDADPIGVVTSSTLSPMLGWAPICFAAIRPGSERPGTPLLIDAQEDRLRATVQPTLTFWSHT